MTGKFFSGITLMIQGYPQGQKVNFKIKLLKMLFLTNTIRDKCNDFFGVILTTESIYQIIMVTQGHLKDQNVYSKGLRGIL